jgi:hypothetical protein
MRLTSPPPCRSTRPSQAGSNAPVINACSLARSDLLQQAASRWPPAREHDIDKRAPASDELLVILRDRRLLPVTVGVAGDWGSGKSSLIGMAEVGPSEVQASLGCASAREYTLTVI